MNTSPLHMPVRLTTPSQHGSFVAPQLNEPPPTYARCGSPVVTLNDDARDLAPPPYRADSPSPYVRTRLTRISLHTVEAREVVHVRAHVFPRAQELRVVATPRPPLVDALSMPKLPWLMPSLYVGVAMFAVGLAFGTPATKPSADCTDASDTTNCNNFGSAIYILALVGAASGLALGVTSHKVASKLHARVASDPRAQLVSAPLAHKLARGEPIGILALAALLGTMLGSILYTTNHDVSHTVAGALLGAGTSLLAGHPAYLGFVSCGALPLAALHYADRPDNDLELQQPQTVETL